MKVVHGDKQYKCSVLECGKFYQSKQSLRNHHGKVHDPKAKESLKAAAKFICEVCGKVLTTGGALKVFFIKN